MNETPRPTRDLLRAAALCCLGGAAYFVAFLLRFPGEDFAQARGVLFGAMGWVLAAKLATILYFRLHQGWSRFVSFHELLVIVQAVTTATVAATVFDALLISQWTLPRSILLLDWGATLVAWAGLRGLLRVALDTTLNPFVAASGVRVLIVGANPAGEALLRAIKQCAELEYRPVGFVQDGPLLRGRRLAGLPVVGALDDISELVARHAVAEVLINADQLPGKRVRELVCLADAGNFRVKVLPSYEQLLAERVKVQPRPVNIADLLRRPSVQHDDEQTRACLAGRTVLITGSSGSIGSELCRQVLEQTPQRLLALDRSETGQFFLERELRRRFPDAEIEVLLGDLTDSDRIEAIFDEHRPHLVFHAAAYKHVPLMEKHPGEAVKNIVVATRLLADAADRFSVERFVMISTDKAVNPTSVMGSCKRLAEQYVQAKSSGSACRYITVRFGNVLDSAGSVVPVFREQIARGGPVTVTDERMVRYFMLIPEAAQLVIQAGAMGRGGEIFVLDMGEPVRVIDLARDMIRLSGLRVGDDIEIQITGLRPGEKLYEELYGAEEHHQATAREKIMVASGQPRRLVEVIYDIGRLEEVSNGPPAATAALIRQIIPPYIATPQRRVA